MKKAEVEVGKVYLMNHTSGKVPVRIHRAISRTCYGHWTGETRTVTKGKQRTSKPAG